MSRTNPAIASLFAVICIGLFVLGSTAAYQSWATLGASELHLQSMQTLLLSGVALWLALFGLWLVLPYLGGRRVTRTREVAEGSGEYREGPSVFSVEEEDSEFWFYFKIRFASGGYWLFDSLFPFKMTMPSATKPIHNDSTYTESRLGYPAFYSPEKRSCGALK